MGKNEVQLYRNKVYGFTVSDYGLENGYLDYRTLSKIVGDCILNNNLIEETRFVGWELVNGDDYGEYEYEEIYQYYIISDSGYEILSRLTDEIVYYNDALGVYLWGITHFGTSWDYVLTDVKLIQG
jgi:hypothetical protein